MGLKLKNTKVTLVILYLRVFLKLALFIIKFENKLDIVISHINLISKQHDKCKFALKVIQFITIPDLFVLVVVQKCQLCQLCVLWENSHAKDLYLPWVQCKC